MGGCSLNVDHSSLVSLSFLRMVGGLPKLEYIYGPLCDKILSVKTPPQNRSPNSRKPLSLFIPIYLYMILYTSCTSPITLYRDTDFFLGRFYLGFLASAILLCAQRVLLL